MDRLQNKHIPVLDGIRAFAILLVCLAHFFAVDENYLYNSNAILGSVIFKISRIGLRGVELFFLLSGFLITNILLESKKSSRYFTTFYARRFLRIFPLYYFVLTICFIILPQITSLDLNANRVIQNQVWLWTYTSNLPSLSASFWNGGSNFPGFGHFWSLCVEEHFYVFWPFLIYFSNEKWLPRLMWSVVLISVFSILFVYLSNNMFPILSWTTIRCMGVLSLGGLIAYYKKNTIIYEKIITVSNKTIIPFGILFLIVSFIPRRYELQEILVYFTAVIFFSELIIVSFEGNRFASMIFNHKPLFFIGKISYGIYVYHGIFMHIFVKYQGCIKFYISNGVIGTIIYTLICTTVSVFIAWVSWIIIEQPILKLKKHFNY
jgi:peptidoglycan/LPS O-acetylase OafA/YrhL